MNTQECRILIALLLLKIQIIKLSLYLLLMERRKICRYFERGSCRKQNCPFVHLRENRKNCTFYMEGHCRKGANCNFYHPPKESEKLANLKQQLKAKKNNKPLNKQSSDEQEQAEQHHEVQVKPERPKEQQDEAREEENDQLNEKQEPAVKYEKEVLGLNEKKLQVQKQINQRNQKIQKINFLLGLNQNNESSQQNSDEDEEDINDKVGQIQFVKTYLKKFPDFSKTPEMKAQILKNEQLYFKGEKYLDLINKITDSTQKQYYQIIRKFTDHFRHQQNEPRHFSIRIRPLLFDKEINLHFEFVEDTLDLDVDATKYPESRATFTILNKSIPEQYKEKIVDILNKYHAKATLFDTLKLLQNKFEKIYQESKFRLQNEHYSKKQLQRKLKEEKKAAKSEQTTQTTVAKKKKVRKQANNDHPDVKIIKYKQGEKPEHLNYNYEISVESIVLQNCQYVVVEKILVYIECVCEKKIAYLFDATNDRSLIVGTKLQCKKCRNLIVLGLQRQVVQVRRELLGRIGVNHGHLIDVGGVGFKIGCTCNNEISKAKLYLPGQRITSNCHHCFQSMLISYMGLKSYNPTIKAPQVKVDTELPLKGTCKHVKLSFRWFRYGCCGRCFSCDDCHIMESCVVHEKIKGITMLCGFCSKQQPIGNDCSYCHKQLLKGMDKTGHWQGGMGCRDQALLSRKDAKKYTGMTKHKEK